MATLTLETELVPCDWSAIEHKLAGLLLAMKIISQSEDKRVYLFNFPAHNQPILLLKEMQGLLAHEEIHFFVDLKS
ncbi:MAG: hypothetical protein KKD73_12695 [Proteobacteria bacterium]|nr:hypothetical protein [Pseudomonadota bacterium]MBU1640894.1 hypothetical protein [Pseudomonadota bacterium]